MTSQDQEMVERVARAIYEGRNGKGAIPWSRREWSHREPYLKDARAAIEAMMEPSKPMVFFGVDAMCRDDLDPTEDEFRAGFSAAIKAALGETFRATPSEPHGPGEKT